MNCEEPSLKYFNLVFKVIVSFTSWYNLLKYEVESYILSFFTDFRIF